ncbi:MAG: FixH family protein [Myxococcota bacterium]
MSTLVAFVACDGGREGASPASPGASDPASGPGWEAASNDGLYRVRFAPRGGPARLGVLHDWVVHVEAADGSRFEATRITVDGGMPQHGHGLVTVPRVTRSLGDGDYLVEGMKFHMPGEWTFQIGVVGPAGGDSATLLVQIDP